MADKRWGLALTTALAMAGCKSTQVGGGGHDGPAAKSYAPIPVGASWTYEAEFQGHREVMTAQLVGQKDGFVVDNRNSAFRHTQDGLRDRDRYLIKHPIQVGTKWKAVTGPSAVEHLEITSVGDPCEAIAGKFSDCLTVVGKIRRDKNMTLEIAWTWAKDVGLVKLETRAHLAGKGVVPQSSLSLKDYSLDGSKAPPAPESAPSAVKESAPKTESSSDDDDGPNTWTSE